MTDKLIVIQKNKLYNLVSYLCHFFAVIGNFLRRQLPKFPVDHPCPSLEMTINYFSEVVIHLILMLYNVACDKIGNLRA